MQYAKLAAAAAALGLCVGAQSAEAGTPPIDSTLFATYNFSAGATSVQFTVCGSLPGSEGCYGGGTLAPIGGACGVLESSRKTKGDVVTRDIYVLDRGATKNATLMLDVFRRTDTISSSYDSIQVSFLKSVSLGIVGGPSAKCTMAGNETAVYAGTDQDGSVASVDKTTFIHMRVPRTARFAKSTSVLSLTADTYGYIAVSTPEGFYVVSPLGGGEEDGGGSAYMVNTLQGFIPSP
ncbi:MAG: hypothetical protein ABSA49_13425 [Rhizomicrobium sp.]|jgi:hypothetical protein